MARTAQAAKLASGNLCSASLMALAEACSDDAKNTSVGPVLAPFALQALFRMLSSRLASAPQTADVLALASRLKPLLRLLGRSGIQDSDRFNHDVDDALRSLRDLIP